MLESPIASKLNGVIGDQIKVDPKYIAPVEAALGESINALVAKDRKTALDAIQFIKRNNSRADLCT